MKKEFTPLFGNIFGATGRSMESERVTPVIVSSYSQPHVLHQRMREEKLTHGETVTANISPVRLEGSYNSMVIYFCPMQNIEIIQKVNTGDGGSLPFGVTVEGLTIPRHFKPGLYSLKHVTLSSNGTLQVIATEKTVWETV
jgi:hypothetical protein